MIVYHGTSARHEEAIRRDGLREVNGVVGPFVTTRVVWAVGYAVRAICVDRADDVEASPRAVLFAVEVDPSRLAQDPMDGRGDDYVIKGGCDPAQIVGCQHFDASHHLERLGASCVSRMAFNAIVSRLNERVAGRRRFQAGRRPQSAAARSSSPVQSAARPAPFETARRVARGPSTSERPGRR